MTGEPATAPLIGGVGLLERAISYTLGSLHLVTPEAMPRATPCAAWDLRALLAHMNDSLAALHEAVETGRVDLDVVADGAGDPAAALADPVGAIRSRACRLLGAWTNAGDDGVVSIAGHPLTSSIVAGTGAIEIAVHGWDVARACGHPRPIPAPLAEELLPLAALLVSTADRPGRFAPPVAGLRLQTPGDRLLAFLGRDPR
jgi:uncharacterized protein (TIGR03086 family)